MTISPDVLVLLDRYRTGECTPAEAAEIGRRLATDPAWAGARAWLSDLALDAVRGSTPAVAETDWLWAETRRAIHVGDPASEPAPRALRSALALWPARPRRSWPALAIRVGVAAAVALVVGGAIWWQAARSRARGAPAQEFATGLGERRVVRLPDGSRVTLAAASRLEVSAGYGQRGRDVSLDGEGYFEIAPNPAVPFRVSSERAITQVLGTAFGVRAYRADSAVSVVVARGSVAVTARSGAPASVVLAPGDLARLDRDRPFAVQHGVAVDRYTGWAEGRLVFVDAPLREVLPELERWYDLDISLADSSLASRPLTATFQEDSPAHMLQLLCWTLGLRAERQGRAVTLHAKS